MCETCLGAQFHASSRCASFGGIACRRVVGVPPLAITDVAYAIVNLWMTAGATTMVHIRLPGLILGRSYIDLHRYHHPMPVSHYDITIMKFSS